MTTKPKNAAAVALGSMRKTMTPQAIEQRRAASVKSAAVRAAKKEAK